MDASQSYRMNNNNDAMEELHNEIDLFKALMISERENLKKERHKIERLAVDRAMDQLGITDAWEKERALLEDEKERALNEQKEKLRVEHTIAIDKLNKAHTVALDNLKNIHASEVKELEGALEVESRPRMEWENTFREKYITKENILISELRKFDVDLKKTKITLEKTDEAFRKCHAELKQSKVDLSEIESDLRHTEMALRQTGMALRQTEETLKLKEQALRDISSSPMPHDVTRLKLSDLEWIISAHDEIVSEREAVRNCPICCERIGEVPPNVTWGCHCVAERLCETCVANLVAIDSNCPFCRKSL